MLWCCSAGAGHKPTGETHEVAQRKLDQMAKLKSAFGLSEVKEGDAFNRDLQVRCRHMRPACGHDAVIHTCKAKSMR